MTTAAEVMVRMGEMAVSRTPGDVLVSIGLGSCIGLCMIDRRRQAVGLAHVMLPTGGPGDTPGKFAPHAVPALVDELERLGAVKTALEAVLLLDSQLTVEGGEECSPSFMFIPSAGGVDELLSRLGL